jgi:hypothetical protein
MPTGLRARVSRLGGLKLEIGPIQTQMAQKPVLRAELHAHTLRVSQNVKRAEVWTGPARVALV